MTEVIYSRQQMQEAVRAEAKKAHETGRQEDGEKLKAALADLEKWQDIKPLVGYLKTLETRKDNLKRSLNNERLKPKEFVEAFKALEGKQLKALTQLLRSV